MDIQAKRKELTALVDNIKENSDRLTVSQTLPALELSVLISKIAKLYEEAIILRHEISRLEYSVVEELLEKPELKIREKEKMATPTIKEKMPDMLPEQPIEAIPVKEERVGEKGKLEEAPQSTKTDELNVEKLEDESIEVASITPYEVDFQDLNTKLSGKEDGSVADQLQKQPIADLTTAVGLNERYLYSNELFGGNMDLFREALKELNHKNNLQEANSYLKNELAKKHQWDLDHELVNSLGLLVERRFR